MRQHRPKGRLRQIAFRLPKDLQEWIDRESLRVGCTISDVVRIALIRMREDTKFEFEEALKQYKPASPCLIVDGVCLMCGDLMEEGETCDL